MPKIGYYILLLMVVLVPTGCETVHGMGQDAQNLTNPDKNGWNAAKRADAWMQENMW
jgi:predicted small secreted protein